MSQEEEEEEEEEQQQEEEEVASIITLGACTAANQIPIKLLLNNNIRDLLHVPSQ